MRDTAIIIDTMIQTQGGNVGVLREYAEKRDMAFFAADSPLGAFDSIFVKRKLNVRNLIFITTYESANVEFKADIKICANKNPSILLGLLDEFYYKYIKPFHTLDGQYDNCNNRTISNNENTFTWYGEQNATNETKWGYGEQNATNETKWVVPDYQQAQQEPTQEEMFIRL